MLWIDASGARDIDTTSCHGIEINGPAAVHHPYCCTAHQDPRALELVDPSSRFVPLGHQGGVLRRRSAIAMCVFWTDVHSTCMRVTLHAAVATSDHHQASSAVRFLLRRWACCAEERRFRIDRSSRHRRALPEMPLIPPSKICLQWSPSVPSEYVWGNAARASRNVTDVLRRPRCCALSPRASHRDGGVTCALWSGPRL